MVITTKKLKMKENQLERTKRKIDLFLNESKPYFDVLARIEDLKPKKFIVNSVSGEIKNLHNEDTKEQIEIKKIIDYLRELYLSDLS